LAPLFLAPLYQFYLTTLLTTVRQYSPTIGMLALTHLWFVPRLLVVSLLTLPLLVSLQRRGQHTISRIARAGASPLGLLFGGALVPSLLVALVQPG